MVTDALRANSIEGWCVAWYHSQSKYCHRPWWDSCLTTVTIPHLVRKDTFWGAEPPAISHAYLQFKRLTDESVYSRLKRVESVESGRQPPLARRDQFNVAMGRNSATTAGRFLKLKGWWVLDDCASVLVSCFGMATLEEHMMKRTNKKRNEEKKKNN